MFLDMLLSNTAMQPLFLIFAFLFLMVDAFFHPLQAASALPLLSNGDFETGSDKPAGWPLPDGAAWSLEEGNHFLTVTARPEKMVTVYREVPLSDDLHALRLRFRVRINELKRGKANWHDGRIILDFKDADGKKLSGASPQVFTGTTKGWSERSVEFLVPPGAVKLELMPAMFMAASGAFDLDDFELSPTDPAPIVAKKEAADKKKAEDIAKRASRVKPQVSKATEAQLPPMLHVSGNQILNSSGVAVWLQGVSIPSLEWSASGDNVLKSTRVAIEDWKANVIRLSIRDDFWRGSGPYQADGGAGYRQLIDDVVNLAGSKRAYVVLDLHRFRAPEEKHADFWRALAGKYKNHPAVLFELFNEPHDLTWEVWRDGGFVSTEKKADSTVVAENKEKLKGFASIGIQSLIGAVRSTGAKNIVIAGGLDWSYDLSGILNGFPLQDPDGNGIVYSTHVYPWKSDWMGKFIKAAEQHPIFIGECGASQERMSFIPPEQHEDPSTWVPDFLGLVQKHRYHWAAWCFHPKSSPCLLSDWDYTPTTYWGAHAKAALAGQKFVPGRLR